MTAAAKTSPVFDRVTFARRIVLAEAGALKLAADRLGEEFDLAVAKLFHNRGRVVVLGVGKSADVGQKIVGTFNSTGTRAYMLDATRAMHGDLGAISPEDIALLLSHSGESEELLRLLPSLRSLTSGLIAITGNATSSLAKAMDVSIVYGPVAEACPLSLAPSASTTIMLALGDAIAFCLSEERRFGPEDFAKFHPAGSLGKKLAAVETAMRRGADLRVASANATVRSVFEAEHAGRRTGAVMLLETDGTLAGLFTDSDLARLFKARSDAVFDQPIRNVMTRTPLTVTPAVRLVEAAELMRSKKISELPVVDALGRPVGLLDITDLIGLAPPANDGGTRPALKLFERTPERKLVDLTARASAIGLLLLDVDGVLTDGRLHYSEDGVETKSFHVRDGSGIKLWQTAGKRAAIISGRNAKCVEKRAAELGIAPVLQGQHPKDAAYREVLVATGMKPYQVCVVGDDLMDLPLMLASGLSVAVADAVPEVRAAASFVTNASGGRGAVRETIEWLLTLTGQWKALVENYSVKAG